MTSPTPGSPARRPNDAVLNVFGEVAHGIRLLGGVAYIDSTLTKTAGGINDGNKGIAAPEWRIVAGAEWDTFFMRGLTLSGRVLWNDASYLDAANKSKAPGWTRVDLGGRYFIGLPKGQSVVIRVDIENVFDVNYWDITSNEMVLSEPRTFKLSTSFNF
jgi:iron complex outermembrane receptor protein